MKFETKTIDLPGGGKREISEITFTFESIPGSDGWETLNELATIFEGTMLLALSKSKTYGSAWREQGWMGNLSRIMSKTARLRNMLWQENYLNDAEEPVDDTLLDLINLSAFALLNRRDHNRWGRR